MVAVLSHVIRRSGRATDPSRGAARRGVWRRALAVPLVAMCMTAGAAAPPYAFVQPDFLNEPKESKSLYGSTYAYLPRSAGANTRLLVTLMPAKEIRARFAELSDTDCINLFMDEVRGTHKGFFVVSMARPMRVGDAEFPRFRWTGEKSGKTMTGVLGCGQISGYYFVVHFSDELKSATRSFPAIRASLRSLAPRAN